MGSREWNRTAVRYLAPQLLIRGNPELTRMCLLKYLGREVKKRSCLSWKWMDFCLLARDEECGEVAGIAGLERKSSFLGYSFCFPCFGAVP